MIKNSKQDWTVGSTVKVGFLSLESPGRHPHPGDYAPDAYILTSRQRSQLYRFVPHNGLERITVAEAREMVAAGEKVARRTADEALDAAMHQAEIGAQIAALGL